MKETDDKRFLETMTLERLAKGFIKTPNYLKFLKIVPSELRTEIRKFKTTKVEELSVEELDDLIRYINLKNNENIMKKTENKFYEELIKESNDEMLKKVDGKDRGGSHAILNIPLEFDELVESIEKHFNDLEVVESTDEDIRLYKMKNLIPEDLVPKVLIKLPNMIIMSFENYYMTDPDITYEYQTPNHFRFVPNFLNSAYVEWTQLFYPIYKDNKGFFKVKNEKRRSI